MRVIWMSSMIVAVAIHTPFEARAQRPGDSAFTYQGRLIQAGNPANGPYDMEFRLFETALGNTQVGPTRCRDGVDVEEGLFTVLLDFGDVFDGNERYLQIALRPDSTLDNCGQAALETLAPRQLLSAVPYALHVAGIDGHSLDAADGSPADALFVNNSGNVGIGTIAPVERLTVVGRIHSTTGGMRYPDSTVQTTAGGACVRTIGELRALAAPAGGAGDVPSVRVLGYSAPNDDGGGLFYWDFAATDLDDGGTVIAGNSLPPAGRWRRAFSGPVHAEWWGPSGDGVSDDTSALQRAFNAAAGRGIVFSRAATYAFGPLLAIPSDTSIRNNGAVLRLRSSVPVSDSSTAITCGARVHGDLLKIEVAAGVPVRRLIFLGNENDFDRIEVSSDDQQTVFQGNLDAAVQIRSAGVHVKYLSVRHFDYGLTLYAAGRATVEHLDIQDYILGVHIQQSSFVQLLSGQVSNPSSAAIFQAGNNGVLIENSDDITVCNFTVHDSGEHALRVGGDANSSRIVFSNIVAIRPGGCGLKLRANPGFRIRDVQVNGLTVVDAGATASQPFLNQDGLRLEGCSNVTANGVQVQSQSRTYSAHDGIWVTNCDMVTINGPRLSNVRYNGVHLNDSDGPVNQVFVNEPTVLFSATNGILIDSPAQILRDITIMRGYIRGFPQYGIRLIANSPTAGVNQPVILDGYIRNDIGLGGVLISTTDPDVHNLTTVY